MHRSHSKRNERFLVLWHYSHTASHQKGNSAFKNTSERHKLKSEFMLASNKTLQIISCTGLHS